MKKIYIGSAYYVKIENEEQEKKIVALKEKFVAELKQLGGGYITYATSKISDDFHTVVDYEVDEKCNPFWDFLKIKNVENFQGKITDEEAEIKAMEISLQKRKESQNKKGAE